MAQEPTGAPHWHDVFWREWTHGEDELLAAKLYADVAHAPASAEARAAAARAGEMGWIVGGGVVGAVAAVMLGSVVAAQVHGDAGGFVMLMFLTLGILGGLAAGAKFVSTQAALRQGTVEWHTLLTSCRRTFEYQWRQGKKRGFASIIDGVSEPDAYGYRLRMLPRELRPYASWWRDRPGRDELFLAMAEPDAPEWARRVVASPELDARRTVDDLIRAFASGDVEQRYRAYYLMIFREGECMDALTAAIRNQWVDKDLALELVRWIAWSTERRYMHRLKGHLCPRCFTRFGAHREKLGLLSGVTYYGCRSCRQSTESLQHGGPVLAVLDSEDPRESWTEGRFLCVNWTLRARKTSFEGQALFDFDAVHIRHATDDEVRHFIVDITSDTDKARRKRYKDMPVTLAPSCDLSPNTRAALKECLPEA